MTPVNTNSPANTASADSPTPTLEGVPDDILEKLMYAIIGPSVVIDTLEHLEDLEEQGLL